MKEVTCTVSKVFVPVQQILTLHCPIFRNLSYLSKRSQSSSDSDLLFPPFANRSFDQIVKEVRASDSLGVHGKSLQTVNCIT